MRLCPSPTLLTLCGLVAGLLTTMTVLMFFEYENGPVRGAILAALLAATLTLRLLPARPLRHDDLVWLRVMLVFLGLAAAGSMAIGINTTMRLHLSGRALVDQAENTYRAALYLRRGENPYGRGMLLDLMAYEDRQPLRDASGIGSGMTHGAQRAMLLDFWRTLDPALRTKLLPLPPADALAQREYAALGYKYGPVTLLAVAALAPAMGIGAVGLLNLLVVIAWAAAMGALLLRQGWSLGWGAAAAALVLVDPQVMKAYMFYTCLDAWPMLFMALAVAAFLAGRKVAVGVLLAVAVGCKLFPSLILLPFLLATRSWRATAAFAALVAAFYLPWFIWEPQGFITNILLWPALNLPDTTSWVVYAPPAFVWTARLALLGIVAAVSLRFLRATTNDPRLIVWSLAVLNLCVVAASGVIHNNYLPWFSSWLVLTIMVQTVTQAGIAEEPRQPLSQPFAERPATAN